MSMKLLRKFHESDTPPFDIIHFHDWHCIDALEELRDRTTVMSYHSTEYGRNGGNFSGTGLNSTPSLQKSGAGVTWPVT